MPALRGKVVIVTGASSGFGEASARLFAQEGCRVLAAARRIDRLEQLSTEIREKGGEALPFALDVSQPDRIEAMVQAALSVYGRIDILFNNAGFGRLDWLEALDPIADIQTQITVDLLGAIWTARAVLPHMYREHSGHIINMGSMAGWVAPPLYTTYAAAKFGLRGFSEALRRESTPLGVKVSEIFPSGATTEFGRHIGGSPAKRRFTMPRWLTLTAEDVARSVVGLAKHPRSRLVIPWWMGVPRLLNTLLPGISDVVQSRALRAYHRIG